MKSETTSSAKMSMVDIEKYRSLSEEERREKVKKILDKIREESLDPLALDVPQRDIEYLND